MRASDRTRGRCVTKRGCSATLLPLIEGTTVSNKARCGQKPHHILFIASGAFHIAKPAICCLKLARPPAHSGCGAARAEPKVIFVRNPDGNG